MKGNVTVKCGRPVMDAKMLMVSVIQKGLYNSQRQKTFVYCYSKFTDNKTVSVLKTECNDIHLFVCPCIILFIGQSFCLFPFSMSSSVSMLINLLMLSLTIHAKSMWINGLYLIKTVSLCTSLSSGQRMTLESHLHQQYVCTPFDCSCWLDYCQSWQILNLRTQFLF